MLKKFRVAELSLIINSCRSLKLFLKTRWFYNRIVTLQHIYSIYSIFSTHRRSSKIGYPAPSHILSGRTSPIVCRQSTYIFNQQSADNVCRQCLSVRMSKIEFCLIGMKKDE